jgi:hypothetical protein
MAPPELPSAAVCHDSRSPGTGSVAPAHHGFQPWRDVEDTHGQVNRPWRRGAKRNGRTASKQAGEQRHDCERGRSRQCQQVWNSEGGSAALRHLSAPVDGREVKFGRPMLCSRRHQASSRPAPSFGIPVDRLRPAQDPLSNGHKGPVRSGLEAVCERGGLALPEKRIAPHRHPIRPLRPRLHFRRRRKPLLWLRSMSPEPRLPK